MNRIVMGLDGPYCCAGKVHLRAADGSPMAVSERMLLCACGASGDKPYCDGSHGASGFRNALPSVGRIDASLDDAAAPLLIRARKDGPLKLDGPAEVIGPDGGLFFRGTETALCRCGQSSRKPFCDGTHRAVGFIA